MHKFPKGKQLKYKIPELREATPRGFTKFSYYLTEDNQELQSRENLHGSPQSPNTL